MEYEAEANEGSYTRTGLPSEDEDWERPAVDRSEVKLEVEREGRDMNGSEGVRDSVVKGRASREEDATALG